MGFKILLVNPNRMRTPPVIPIGLEHVKSALEKHENLVNMVDLLDLTFEEDPRSSLLEALKHNDYDLVGFTIRNIDSCIYFNNEFYLPEIKELVKIPKGLGIPIILGGAGFSAMPEEIRKYLDADYGIIGPSENALPIFLKKLDTKQDLSPLMDGWEFGIDGHSVYSRGDELDYEKYMANEGIVGFRTHVGCDGKCPYCMESNKKLFYREIPSVIQEIQHLVKQDYKHFHLCDSEFNTDLNYCLDLLNELKNKNLDMKWTLYMKPTPFNEKLYQLLSETGAYLITLTVDSDERIQTMNNYDYDDLRQISDYCKKYDIDLAIDLLVGYPGESLTSVPKMLNFFKEIRPKSVGISFYYRLFRNTPLGELIMKDSNLRENLSRDLISNDPFLEPVFFSQLKLRDIEEIINDDDLFQIAGMKAGVNYQL